MSLGVAWLLLQAPADRVPAALRPLVLGPVSGAVVAALAGEALARRA